MPKIYFLRKLFLAEKDGRFERARHAFAEFCRYTVSTQWADAFGGHRGKFQRAHFSLDFLNDANIRNLETITKEQNRNRIKTRVENLKPINLIFFPCL